MHYDIRFNRIASADTLFWIACASTVNTVNGAAAVYMRAHREEPMLPVSVVSALLTLAVVTLLRHDVPSMMFGYSAISACFSALDLSCYLVVVELDIVNWLNHSLLVAPPWITVLKHCHWARFTFMPHAKPNGIVSTI